jgi:E3 ubiquitin-protein ligase HUWE1
VANFHAVLDSTSAELDKLNELYRHLVNINNTIALLSELFCHVGFAHGRVATAFLESLGASSGSRVLSHLGRFHRSSIAANILLKVEKPDDATEKKGKDVVEPPLMEQVMLPLLETRPSTVDATSEARLTQPGQESQSVAVPWPKWKQDNYSSVKYLATHISMTLTPFFTCEFLRVGIALRVLMHFS